MLTEVSCFKVHSDFQTPLSPNDDGRVYDTPYDYGNVHPCSRNDNEWNFPENNSQGRHDLRRSSRNSKMPVKFNDYVVNSSRKNTIELLKGKNVVPLRSDTIWLVQNRCSFHELRSEYLNQHLKDFLKLLDSLDLNGDNRGKTRLPLFQFSIRDQASNWLERLPAGSITTWEDLTTQDLALYENESLNGPRDFAKPVKVISLPEDVLSTFDCCLIELKNQVQRLMEAHLALIQPTQMNKFTSSCQIYSGPHNTQYCMENPEQAFIEYVSSRTDVAGVRSTPSESINATLMMTCQKGMSQKENLINTIRIHQCNPHDDMPEGDEPKGEVNHENTNTVEHKEEQRGTPQLELKDPTAISKTGPSMGDEEGEIEWVDVEKPLDLVDTCEESVCESLIKEMPKCSLNCNFRIKNGDPTTLKSLA
nr:MAK10-like protein [Tanacetum cinerariifolium]